MVDQGLIEAADSRAAPDAADECRNYYRIVNLGPHIAEAEGRRFDALTRAARLGGLLEKEAK
jgi:hypothetical protein